MLVLPCLRSNRKSDLKDKGRDGESNKAFPLTPPSPPGRGRTCDRFGNIRAMLASIPPSKHDAKAPDQHLHDRTPWRTRPFQTSRVVLPLPWGEGWGEGEGITLSFTAFFSPLAPSLNSTENSKEPLFSD